MRLRDFTDAESGAFLRDWGVQLSVLIAKLDNAARRMSPQALATLDAIPGQQDLEFIAENCVVLGERLMVTANEEQDA